ncbi:AfsR/SARP family transcriptional regulator [Streptomyces sp. NBC_00006]|uniref:ATP-binding protein n=1 Tax=Streptomyces sp. NBC_00006 TaxID=2975619 RepID=UPI002251E881|nr:BTAD domain-containing putative transcriptional regulator [Streptomyces sp. NBC_00006]MCX5536063.1 AfsR/SARP family transcriptional regulator [Streptomyces sp. NBC_00006]
MATDLTLLPRVAHRGQEVTAPRLRGLLALLASEPRTGCSTERLVAGLWPEELPQHPGKAVQVLVARARAQLGADVIASTPTGYRLGLADDQVDSSALLRYAAVCAERARAGDHAGALAGAEAGLALWEGAPEEAGGTHDPVAALRAERAPVRRELARARALALARLGRYAEAAGPLAETAVRLPRDEEVLAELLRAEAATAGPSTALARYETYRRGLREELGAEPGSQLRHIQAELLRDEPAVVRHGVPHEPNQLLGREKDIAAVERLLREARAVTVVGPGGLGKTRLAYAVTRRAGQRFVHAVPLAGVPADADIAAEVASALGVGEGRHGAVAGHAPADPLSGIVRTLGAGPALLVLDNCEHVVGAVADLVQALLSRARDLRVLATSRSPLGLTSEAVYALPELGPDTSVELFGQRARAARPGVDLPPDAVAELCGHLDGLPLAVELAAARVRALSVPEIARRLGDRFALLRGGVRDVPERHRTLHAVVEWSWNLLADEARAAMCMLSVFPGGFSADAAERVLGKDALDVLDVLGVLEQLVEQSLLTVADTPSGVRFRMLETVREFSAARLAESGEEERALGQLCSWAREFGVAHYDTLLGPRSPDTRELIKCEQDNLVTALRHALARGEGSTTAAVTAVLAALWSTDSDFARLFALAADTGAPLSHYRPEPGYVEVARAAAVLCAASLIVDHAPRVLRHLVTLRRLPAAPPDTLLRAIAVVLVAVPEMLPPDYDVLRELCDSDYPLVVSVAESVATYVWEYEHDIGRTLASARRVVDVLAAVDSPPLEVMGYSRLSQLCLTTGDGDAAYRYLGAAREALPRFGDENDYVGIRWGFALACLQRADPDEAETWQRRAQAEGTAQKDPFYSPDLGVCAEIALARGDTEAGLELWRRAVARLPAAGAQHDGELWHDPWALQIQATAVTAHAYADRLAPVADTVDRLRAVLAGPTADQLALSVLGTVLHALGAAGLTDRTPEAVRTLALAERLWVLRDFEPTMAAARARQAAESADRAAYTDAVAEYAALGRDELRDAARAVATPDRG